MKHPTRTRVTGIAASCLQWRWMFSAVWIRMSVDDAHGYNHLQHHDSSPSECVTNTTRMSPCSFRNDDSLADDVDAGPCELGTFQRLSAQNIVLDATDEHDCIGVREHRHSADLVSVWQAGAAKPVAELQAREAEGGRSDRQPGRTLIKHIFIAVARSVRATDSPQAHTSSASFSRERRKRKKKK
eukprot:2499541-Rhodomonas_salina.6